MNSSNDGDVHNLDAFGTQLLSCSIAWHLLVIWTAEFARVAVLIFFLLFPGWFLLDVARTRLPRALSEGAILLAFPASATLIAIWTLLLQTVDAPSDIFSLSAWLLYGIPLVLVLADRQRRSRAWRAWYDARFFLLLPALVAVCAICYAAVGLPSFDRIDDWTRLAWRNVHELPIDNALSWLTSQTWRAHAPPLDAPLPYPWRIGDRGPLYSLLHLFLSRAFELDSPTYANYTRLGIVLNSLFLGPLLLWLSNFFRRRVAWLCTALVGLNPWFFLNIYFTWPKLLGVYFLLAAICLLWRRDVFRTPALLAAGGVLMGLAALAHPGALLSLPMFVIVTFAAFVRSRREALTWIIVPIAVVVMLTPWQLYKRWYTPETYSLLYWNFLDEKGLFTPLKENVARFFTEHPRAEQLAIRKVHLRDLWWGSLSRSLIIGVWTRRKIGATLYVHEFFEPWYSAGIVWFAWIVVVLPLAAGLSIVRTYTRVARSRTARLIEWLSPHTRTNIAVPVWPAVVFVALSLTLNEFLRWRPPYSHELPYLELVLLAALMLVALARLGRAYLVFPILGVIARQAFYFHESSRVSRLRLPRMDGFGRLYWITLAVILVMTLLLPRQRQEA
jgi:hypothetical protein